LNELLDRILAIYNCIGGGSSDQATETYNCMDEWLYMGNLEKGSRYH
jgi:hypothetical protein